MLSISDSVLTCIFWYNCQKKNTKPHRRPKIWAWAFGHWSRSRRLKTFDFGWSLGPSVDLWVRSNSGVLWGWKKNSEESRDHQNVHLGVSKVKISRETPWFGMLEEPPGIPNTYLLFTSTWVGVICTYLKGELLNKCKFSCIQCSIIF